MVAFDLHVGHTAFLPTIFAVQNGFLSATKYEPSLRIHLAMHEYPKKWPHFTEAKRCSPALVYSYNERRCEDEKQRVKSTQERTSTNLVTYGASIIGIVFSGWRCAERGGPRWLSWDSAAWKYNIKRNALGFLDSVLVLCVITPERVKG